jgi:hypothetical protein
MSTAIAASSTSRLGVIRTALPGGMVTPPADLTGKKCWVGYQR